MTEQSGWQLSGSAPEAYERYLAAPILSPCAPGLIEAAAMTSGERVLDVACGTGAVARCAAHRVGTTGRVTGIDLNTGMLAMARTLAQQGVEAAIEWRDGSATVLPFPDEHFDVVLCQQGLQFFPEKSMALQEMYRVLVPGGRLALSVVRDIQYNPYQRAIAEALGRHVSVEAAAVIHSPFAMGDAEELRSLTTTAGFRDVHLRLEIQVIRYAPVEELVMGYLAATPVAHRIASLDDTTRTAMLHDIKTALSSYMDDDGLAAPLDFRVVTGWK